MKLLGWIALAIGVATAIVALFLDTTAAPAVSSYTLKAIPSMPAEVYNIGLLQQQMLVFVAGCSIALAGVVLVAAGFVIEGRKVIVGSPVDAEQPTPPAVQASPPESVYTASLISSEDELAVKRKQDAMAFRIVLGGVVIGVIVAILISLAGAK